jgi:hypothetical protein
MFEYAPPSKDSLRDDRVVFDAPLPIPFGKQTLWVQFGYKVEGNFARQTDPAKPQQPKQEIQDAKQSILNAITANSGALVPDAKAKDSAETQATHTRLGSTFAGYSREKPLIIVITRERPPDVLPNPQTGRIYISRDDVGNESKLRTAIEIPLEHVQGSITVVGGQPKKLEAASPADLAVTLLHEMLHARLIAIGADSATIWNKYESTILSPAGKIRDRAEEIAALFVLAQEELFIYDEVAKQHGPAKEAPKYRVFRDNAERVIRSRSARLEPITIAIPVPGTVAGKPVPFSITYQIPIELALGSGDARLVELVLLAFPNRPPTRK